jgi:alginate O-acetyltransferase complex protein AlgI
VADAARGVNPHLWRMIPDSGLRTPETLPVFALSAAFIRVNVEMYTSPGSEAVVPPITNFVSPGFAIFFLVVLVISWLLMPFRALWKPFIILASYVFYANAGTPFIFLLAGCTVWNQLWAKLLAVSRGPADSRQLVVDNERARRALTAIAVTGNLAILGTFKYYGFFVSNAVSFTHRLGLPMPLPLVQIALPVGISFFTFQAISYVVDVKRDPSLVASTIDFAMYQAFFPHLLAGPIVRARELIPQFATARDPRRIEFSRAIGLISSGLIKKAIIATYLQTNLVDPVFNNPQLHTRWDVIAAVYGYAVQIYCDFSAYSDIAIGIALLLGFQFPANFNKPYAALSVTDFWRRWHMTLSRWLRDYLYIPLGGNRKGKVNTYRNLMATMLLGGLWHGAAWNFMFWGGLHGSGLAVERWWKERNIPESQREAEPGAPFAPRDPGGPISKVQPRMASHARRASSTIVGQPLLIQLARWFVTFNFVCFAWIFFRAGAAGSAFAMIGRIFVGSGVSIVTAPMVLAIVVGMAIHFVPADPVASLREGFARTPPVFQGLAFAAVILVAAAVISSEGGVPPFIYYRF